MKPVKAIHRIRLVNYPEHTGTVLRLVPRDAILEGDSESLMTQDLRHGLAPCDRFVVRWDPILDAGGNVRLRPQETLVRTDRVEVLR